MFSVQLHANISESTQLLVAVHTWLPRYCNILLWIIISFQFRYSSRDSRLLPSRKFILAALAAGLCCSALFILGVYRDFRRIVAGIDDIGPARRYRRCRIWEDFHVWHGAVIESWSCGEGSEVSWMKLVITWHRVSIMTAGDGMSCGVHSSFEGELE